MRYGSRQKQGEGGFTLIEIIISVVLLSSLAMGTLLTIVPVAKQSRLNKEVEIANTEAQKVLEKVHAVPFNDITTIYPDEASLAIANLTNGIVTVTYDDVTADPLFVRLTVAWDGQDGGNYARSFLTVKTE